MNAPLPKFQLRDPDADRDEAERLIGMLYEQVTWIDEAAQCERDPAVIAQMHTIGSDLRFAADLLGAYAAGLALSTPDPLTGAYLVQRIAVTDELPDSDETVFLWSSDGEDRRPWLGWYDGVGWWFIDSSPAVHVTHWAHRPEGAQ
ncbi:MAG: hypothetical protein JSS57_00225 [Proteobacteria bacterium]|nr:hypothetical protein [Pseudomonadota bacterium]